MLLTFSIVHSNNLENHVKHLEQVVLALTKYCLTISAEKCRLIGTTIEILGHIVANKTISINYSKFNNMMHWPKNKKDYKDFLEL